MPTYNNSQRSKKKLKNKSKQIKLDTKLATIPEQVAIEFGLPKGLQEQKAIKQTSKRKIDEKDAQAFVTPKNKRQKTKSIKSGRDHKNLASKNFKKPRGKYSVGIA